MATTVAFDGVPIGISYGLAEEDGFMVGLADVYGCPGLEYRLGAFQAPVRDLAGHSDYDGPCSENS